MVLLLREFVCSSVRWKRRYWYLKEHFFHEAPYVGNHGWRMKCKLILCEGFGWDRIRFLYNSWYGAFEFVLETGWWKRDVSLLLSRSRPKAKATSASCPTPQQIDWGTQEARKETQPGQLTTTITNDVMLRTCGCRRGWCWRLRLRNWLGIRGLVVRNCFNLHHLSFLGFSFSFCGFFFNKNNNNNCYYCYYYYCYCVFLNPWVFSLLHMWFSTH